MRAMSLALGSRLVVVVAVVAVVGCAAAACGSSSDGTPSTPAGTLDCAWLASNNCWKTTANMATSCLAPAASTGTLSADKRTCTYAAGPVVTFAPALPLPLPDSPTWNVTVTSGGQSCLRYIEPDDGSITLEVKGQTYTEASAGTTGLKVTCPDGAVYTTANMFDLLSCSGGFLGGVADTAWTSSTTSASLSLINTSASSDDSVAVFDCR
jgi:hypothetical protein